MLTRMYVPAYSVKYKVHRKGAPVFLSVPTPFKKFLRCLFTEKVKTTMSFQLQNLMNESSKQLQLHPSVVLAPSLPRLSLPHRHWGRHCTDEMVTMLTCPIKNDSTA